MLKCVLLLCLMTYTICADPPARKKLGDLLHDQFGTGPTNGGSNYEEFPCNTGEECVSYFLCANGTIITTGEGTIDIRFGGERTTEERPCNGYIETCCSLKSPVTTNHDTVEIADGCGYRNSDGVGFRISGNNDNEAQFGEFPWTVAILSDLPVLDTIINAFECGGSLISPGVVLTAAHCVHGKDPATLLIRAGEWDTQTQVELLPHQDRRVSDVVVHELYGGTLFNDVALLFLVEPVKLAGNVNTICLPPQNENFDYKRCLASGWGKDLFGREGTYQVILKRVELPIVPRDKCVRDLRKTRLGTHFELHNSFICAGGEPGKDTCKGDGGSSLVCPIPNTVNQYYQVGIVAWGIGCGGEFPGVYVNVPMFRNWIDEKLQQKRISSTSYIPHH